mgnify:FL=1|jgi:hypothetical protein|tara:strand:- start:181 stop:567 length:387 start_codon:yes stop_codon:yes gene_type:complete
MMTKLTIFLTLLLLVVSPPAIAKAIWSKGDKVMVFFMCHSEDDIMDIAKADAEARERYASTIMEKKVEGFCSRFYPPVELSVKTVIASYKDHDNAETCILKLYDPKTELEAGYIIAAGSPATVKGMSL